MRLPCWTLWKHLNRTRVESVIKVRKLTTLEGTVDRYSGVTVDVQVQISSDTSQDKFGDILKASVKKWRTEGTAVAWLKVPIHCSRFIEAAAKEGFCFHHAEGDFCLLKLWMTGGVDATPRFATHQLGVCGVVLREDTQELLVIQERKTQFSQMWKFPGGLADLGENIGDAAVRETLEETGVKTGMHEHSSAFGRSDMYVVCRLLPVSYDIVPCDREVLRCRWMPITELRDHIKTASMTHRMTTLILHGLKHGFDELDIVDERMKSVNKGQHFTLFHRKLQIL
ncbi:NUDT6-like protein [Mya arenaria]|uniref:NUDT6-like protein n=1 Tax=Mya arenaria TaxID=6604 RepID=A0ABY7DJT7_MYAAR|nr:NUDT6-like protein [Mya arenaria]